VAAVFLLFDALLKFMKPAPVTEAFTRLGFPTSLVLGIGMVRLAGTLVYVIPRTSVLGAILLTGYLGGAVANHVRSSHCESSACVHPAWSGTNCENKDS
jgi:hypothetical protein